MRNNAIDGTRLRGNYTESLFFRALRLHLLLIIIFEWLSYFKGLILLSCCQDLKLLMNTMVVFVI